MGLLRDTQTVSINPNFSQMGIPLHKRFDIMVNDSESVVNEEIILENTTQYISGIGLCSDNDDLLYHRGTLRVEINGKEYLPDNFEAKRLMCGTNVDPNTRTLSLGKQPVVPLNKKVKITYTDNPSNYAGGAFSAYRVSVYLEGMLDD